MSEVQRLRDRAEYFDRRQEYEYTIGDKDIDIAAANEIESMRFLMQSVATHPDTPPFIRGVIKNVLESL